jgi:hypothetical protein
LCTLGCICFNKTAAQDTVIHRNITVERDYKPVIQDVGKINAGPNAMVLKVKKAEPKFSDFNLPLAVEQNINTLAVAEIQHEKHKQLQQGLLRLGMGTQFNTLGDFYTSLIKNRDAKLDLNINHLGTFSNRLHSLSKVSLDYEKIFDALTLNAGISGNHQFFNYYGTNFNNEGKVINNDDATQANNKSVYTEYNLQQLNPLRTPISWLQMDLLNNSNNTFWRGATHVSISSITEQENLQYHIGANYKYFHSINGLSEHFIHSNGGLSIPIDRIRMGVDFDYANMMYQNNIAYLNTFNYWDYYSVMGLNPYLKMNGATWFIRIGAKSSFAMTHGRSFSPSPDIAAEWQLSPKYLAVYGGATGAYTINTLYSSSMENRFLSPDSRIEDTYTPINLYVGFKAKPISGLLVDLFTDYRKIDNQYFYVNKPYYLTKASNSIYENFPLIYTNKFDIVYSSASLMRIGCRIHYQYKNSFNVQLKTTHNKWNVVSELHAWYKPEWETDLSTDLKINKDFHIMASLFTQSASYAKLGDVTMPFSKRIDLNCSAFYSLSRYWTTFVKLNNILNSRYQEYLGYEVQGFNGLIGMTFNLQ